MSCYLPPENSPWGRDAQSFFSHILANIYLNSDVDAVFLLGDFNSRLGNLNDINSEIDDVESRKVTDKTQNQHGHTFAEFLIDSKFCVLNGRFGVESNKYTSISTRGKAVVDYVCVPHDVLLNCKAFKIVNCSDVIQSQNLHSLIGSRSRIPDHAVLAFDSSRRIENDIGNTHVRNIENVEKVHVEPRRRYKLGQVPNDFMRSELARTAILEIIQNIEVLREQQNDFDSLYENFCLLISNEMEKSVPYFDAAPKVRKRFKFNKPYWNQELTDLWNKMHQLEKNFRKMNTRMARSLARREFESAQMVFDRRLRFHERKYKSDLALNVETLSTREFWGVLQNLGPKRKQTVPLEYIDENGTPVYEPSSVLEKWETEFKTLYTNENQCYDDEFLDTAKQHRQFLEDQMLDPLYVSNEFLNSAISIEEVRFVVSHLKDKKSPGIDNIYNEILKSAPLSELLCTLFRFCFETGMVPSIWRKAIICPIPKIQTLDPRIPLNYRGISLLSVVAKCYSSILNNRLQMFLEENDLIVDEQNGFRRNRSCEDHVFTLNSLTAKKIIR